MQVPTVPALFAKAETAKLAWLGRVSALAIRNDAWIGEEITPNELSLAQEGLSRLRVNRFIASSGLLGIVVHILVFFLMMILRSFVDSVCKIVILLGIIHIRLFYLMLGYELRLKSP